VHTDSDEATSELVHDYEHPVAPEHDGFASKEIHPPQAVCRVADERQPRGPGSARGEAKVFRQHAVHDVLVMSTPNVCEMMRAIRGQPNRGLRDLSSTMAWMSAALGPFGPGFFGQGFDDLGELSSPAVFIENPHEWSRLSRRKVYRNADSQNIAGHTLIEEHV
jgi:hypothetical protein